MKNNINDDLNFASPRMRHVDHVHFVGIGGAGMCGIAEVLHEEGYTVTGSDVVENSAVQRLTSLGIKVFIGHSIQNITNADVVVRSTAINNDNIEIIAAIEQRIPVIPRAMMLAELMRFKYGIAVAGTHGKTTTTSLVSTLLKHGGLAPGFVIGGKLNNYNTNAEAGNSAFFVVEADESDASFLFLKPMISVVTNIDADHMETYSGDFATLKKTFIEFLHHLPFYGLAVLCVDDIEVASIVPEVQRPIRTYGFAENAEYRALNWVQEGMLSSFEVQRPKRPSLFIKFNWPGKHNVQNALAAIAIATELGVEDKAIVEGILQFKGVGRRFQILGEKQFSKGKATIIDDYGHHPQEIAATIKAFRAVWPNKRLIHVFQPHRYSRTKALFDDFVEVLKTADLLFLLNIYAAGESNIGDVSSELLVKALKRYNNTVQLVEDTDLSNSLDAVIKDGDVILMQGAGSISQFANKMMVNYERA